MNTYIYPQFKDLPATQVALDKIEKLKEIHQLAMDAIKAELKVAEDKFIAERAKRREEVIWDFTMSEPTINEFGKHYHISRMALNPLAGDDEFYKTINYQSFKIVNNVFIATGGGYILPVNSGHILTKEEIDMLDNNIVPEVLKRTK
jgi:hypothetical protein